MEIVNELRKATGPIHTRIEELPVCKAMLAGEVNAAGYQRLLGSLWCLHSAFEQGVAALGAHWPGGPSRANAIERDLAQLGGVIPGEAPACVADWSEEMAALAVISPTAWAGAGYVFEGSRMGSKVLIGPVSRALGLEIRPGNGLDYHLDGTPDGFRRVMGALIGLDRSPEDRRAMIEAAVRTFEVIYALHQAAAEPAPVAVA